MAVPHRLDPLFNFSSIAVVGASDNPGVGSRVYEGLKALEYEGRYYPINRRNERVQGFKAYPNVSSCPEVPEMVAIAVPRDFVPDVVDECAGLGVKAVVLLANGFLEFDAHGAELQARITATARRTGMLVGGPNCMGLASMVNRCGAASLAPPTVRGNVALISHSGGIMNEIISTGVPRTIAFSHVISAGNEAGVTAAELIDYFVADPATDVILAVLEVAREPGLFAEATARAFEARKPLVVLKMGRSVKGKRSSFTHTRADAGDDAVYAGLFRQHGVVQVNDLDELVDMGALLSPSIDVVRRHRTERAAIVEISGGGKELVCDTAAAADVPLPDLTPETQAALRKANDEDIYATNPIDTGGSWGQEDKAEVYPATMEAFANQADMDIIVSRYTLPRTGPLHALANRVAEMEAARAAHPDRLFVVLSRTSDQYSPEWERIVREKRIPFVQGYGRGLRALGRLREYSLAVHGPRLEPAATEPETESPARRRMGDAEARELMANIGVPLADGGSRQEPGIEIRLGMAGDHQFGPYVTFGLGGLLADVSDDRSTRLAPVAPGQAAAMLDEIRGHRVLDAGRNRPAADRAAIRDALCRLSELALSRREVAEVAIEALVGKTGLVATEVRVELLPTDWNLSAQGT